MTATEIELPLLAIHGTYPQCLRRRRVGQSSTLSPETLANHADSGLGFVRFSELMLGAGAIDHATARGLRVDPDSEDVEREDLPDGSVRITVTVVAYGLAPGERGLRRRDVPTPA